MAIAVLLVTLLGAAHVLGAGGAASGTRTTASSDDAPVVRVGAGDCGRGWAGGAAGPSTFALRNDGPAPVDAYLQDVGTGRIYLDVETLGNGTTRAAHVSLAAGSYRFVCAATETGSVAGPAAQVTGRYAGATTPGLLPVTDADLIGPVLAYQHWVQRRLVRLHQQVRALTDLLRRGDTAAAESAWLRAHSTYVTVGAAYDAFGDFGQPIDGLPRTGVPPPDDPQLTGFHKVEALLWHGRPTAEVVPYATRLDRAVADLQRHFGTDLVLAPIDLGLRAHEILEDSLQLDLQGRTDAGSQTELAAVDAAIDGTHHALAPLLPILRERDPDLRLLQSWLRRLSRTVRSHQVHGAWTPLEHLDRRARERLDADLDQTLELLSQVAVITDPVMPMPGATS